MRLSEFIESEYLEKIQPSEQKFLKKYGRFKDRERVESRLKRQFRNVSFRGKGKDIIISIGKPKLQFDLNTTIEKHMANVILRNYELENYYSKTMWLKKMGLAYDYNNVMKLVKNDGIKNMLYETDINLHKTYLKSRFESVFNQIVKAVDGSLVKVWYGCNYVDLKDEYGKDVTVWGSAELSVKDQLKVVNLCKNAKNSVGHRHDYRKSKLWKKGLKRLKYENIWETYKIANFDENKFNALNEKLEGSIISNPQDVFNRQFTKYLKNKINRKDRDDQEFYEKEFMGGYVATMNAWEEIRSKI